MNKKVLIYFVGILFLLNIFCWKEVFVLAVNNNLKVDFLDVGQGDSVFIKTPGNRQIIIDGGPDSSALGKISSFMPFWSKSIDIVILTHPEKDHMSGLIDILKRYKTDYVLWTGIKKNDSEYKEWINILSKQQKMGAKIIIVKEGDRVRLGNVLVNILYPSENLSGKELKDTSNDAGVVCRLIFGNNSFLFTGDISSKGEKQLIKATSRLKTDVLKVAHHGSKYSTSDEFLAVVNPKIAVIFVGKNNSYGHPTPETLQRLEKFGINVLRTDINGDIEFISDGKNIKIK